MTIERLSPSEEPLAITLNVGVELRPYFTDFYLDNRKENETPEEFLLRLVKRRVIGHYKSKKLEMLETEIQNQADIDAHNLKIDAEQLSTELGE